MRSFVSFPPTPPTERRSSVEHDDASGIMMQYAWLLDVDVDVVGAYAMTFQQ